MLAAGLQRHLVDDAEIGLQSSEENAHIAYNLIHSVGFAADQRVWDHVLNDVVASLLQGRSEVLQRRKLALVVVGAVVDDDVEPLQG